MSFHQVLFSHELGGAGIVALSLAHDLKTRGQVSQVWLPGRGPAECKAEGLGLDVQTYDMTSLFASSKIRVFAANLRMWQKLYSHAPELIHFHSPFTYKAMLLSLKLLRSKRVVHIHLDEDEMALRWALKDPPDLIITCAHFLEAYVRRTLSVEYQESQRIVAVPNPVDIQRFYPGDRCDAKRRVGAHPNIPLVLMIGNLAPHKGQEVAIKATAQLKNEGLDIILWVAGTERGGKPTYTRRLQALCYELGITDRINFLGHREDIPELLRAADLFLLPSTHEGLPLSLLEAQASMVPVLAAPTGGIPEVVIDGQSGFLIAANEPAKYAARIKLLIRNHDLAYEMAGRAYVKIKNERTSQAYFDHIYSLYKNLSHV